MASDPASQTPSLTPETLAAAIKAVRSRYQQEGHSLWDIGNGLCENFADDVLSAAIGENWPILEGQDGQNWWQLSTEGLFDPSNDPGKGISRWDWKLLEHIYGITVEEADRPRFDLLTAQGASHVWIWHDGRHYDCEHPHGTASFFDLNFFQRYLRRSGLPVPQ